MDFVRNHFAKGLCLVALLFPASQVWASDEVGFPSEQACHFMDSLPNLHLAKDGAYYQQEGSKEYYCGTFYWQIVGEPPNNLAYYAAGTTTTVKHMQLFLNLNDTSSVAVDWALQDFAQSVGVLYDKVFKQKLPKAIHTAIFQEKAGQWVKGPYTITLKKDVWPNGGRDLSLTIQEAGYSSDTSP